MTVGKNITWEKIKRGSNIIFLMILKADGNNFKLGKVEGDGIFGNQDLRKNRDGEEYQFVGNFIHP